MAVTSPPSRSVEPGLQQRAKGRYVVAIQSIRVDDITGDPGADVIVIAVGGRAWKVDLVDTSVKQLEEAIRPWTDAGVELPGIAAAAAMVEARTDPPAETPTVAAPAPAVGGVEGESVAADPLAMTAADRANCRAWGRAAPQKTLNRLGITERPANRGSLSPKLIMAWTAEGRPAA